MKGLIRILLISLIVLFQVRCEKAIETGIKPLKPPPGSRFEGRAIYLAADSSDVLWVDLSDSIAEVHSFAMSSDFTLPRVISASGVKYLNSDGTFFWTKGESFIWGIKDSILAEGHMWYDTLGSGISIPKRNFSDSFGHYVTDGYARKDQGYDWVAVSVYPLNQHRVRISVRSRVDKKKPSCTFDGLVTPINDSTLVFHGNDFSIYFNFSGDTLVVGADSRENQNRLFYYCSGGASLAGTYTKIDGPPDSQQIDPASYVQTFNWDNFFFGIQVEKNELTLTPGGLEIDNRPVTHEVEATVYHSEIGDLNQDGYPEILIYLASAGSGSYGTVIGYSVNNGKSISQIYMPPMADAPELSEGYMGHDEFAIVENNLIRRFPVYLPEDSNANPTGGTRQVQYKLVDGEASRRFQVDKVITY